MTLALAATEYGATDQKDQPPLVILHGLFGSGRNWTSIAQRLSEDRHVITLDLPNHGASPWVNSMNYAEMADAVRASLRARGHHRYTLLGHSMGGKVAMVAALIHPDEIDRLIVADIAPVTYPARHLGLVHAMQTLDLDQVSRRSDADRALADAIPDAGERGFLLQNLVFDGDRARWRINLSAIEHNMPALVGFPPIPSRATYPGRALFLAGTNSDYVLAKHEPTIRQWFPAAEIVWIKGAGHWLHVEQPGEFLARVTSFLAAPG